MQLKLHCFLLRIVTNAKEMAYYISPQSVAKFLCRLPLTFRLRSTCIPMCLLQIAMSDSAFLDTGWLLG